MGVHLCKGTTEKYNKAKKCNVKDFFPYEKDQSLWKELRNMEEILTIYKTMSKGNGQPYFKPSQLLRRKKL